MVRRSLPVRIAGIVLKLLVAALVGLTVGVILWRVFFSANTPGKIAEITPDEALVAAYREKGDNLRIFRQDQYPTTTADRNRGYFTVTRAYFYPDANEVQFIFRYNNSTLEHLKEDYHLDTVPEKSGDWFDLSVVVKDKSGTSRRYHAEAEPVRAETALYTYYRVTVKGIRVTDDTEGVFVDIYYKDDVNYLTDAYGTLCIYSYDGENIYESLGTKDKQRLAGEN